MTIKRFLPMACFAGLRHLERLTRFRLLQLYNSTVTDAGMAEVLKALPGVRFFP